MHSELWWGKPVDKDQLGRMNKCCGVHNSKMGLRLRKKKAGASGSGSCPVAGCSTNVAQIFGSNKTKLSTAPTTVASK